MSWRVHNCPRETLFGRPEVRIGMKLFCSIDVCVGPILGNIYGQWNGVTWHRARGPSHFTGGYSLEILCVEAFSHSLARTAALNYNYQGEKPFDGWPRIQLRLITSSTDPKTQMFHVTEFCMYPAGCTVLINRLRMRCWRNLSEN